LNEAGASFPALGSLRQQGSRESIMQHTVIAFFDTNAEAEQARIMLLRAGLTNESIALQARCEPTYATDATTVAEPEPGDEGLLGSIERFFESLFTVQPPQHETAQYAEALRRGAVMLSVDAATDTQCELAKATLERMNPIDVEERAATWSAPGDEAAREQSPLDKLGMRCAGARRRGAVQTYTRETTANAKPEPSPAQPGALPDEYLQNEEDFQGMGHSDSDRS
jgi:hypothetical protein